MEYRGEFYTVILGAEPNIGDIAITSISSNASPGYLNRYVLTALGYSPNKQLPLMSSLERGYSIVADEEKKPVIFVVTVGNGDVTRLLHDNLVEALRYYKKRILGKTIWAPLMGTGAGGLDAQTSFDITIAALKKAALFLPGVHFVISVPRDSQGEALLEKLTSSQPRFDGDGPVGNKISSDIGDDGAERKYYLGGSVWDGDEQAGRFYEQDVWETGHEEKLNNIINGVRVGDIVFLKSTFPVGDVGYLRIKAVGIVSENPHNGTSLGMDWRIILPEPVDIEGLSKYRRTFARVMPDDLYSIVEAIGIAEMVNAGLVNAADYPLQNSEPASQVLLPVVIQNTLQNAHINNDGAQSEKDLLGFENDIRAFAALIALKELKPPLAIALFGQWGSGKSFFIYNLQRKIDFLSKHQGFEQLVPQTDHGIAEEKPFCEGVVQITFNAWAYMDANLWASLAANIFEKLDEYIKGEGKGDEQKKKAREVLSKHLTIVSEEKIKVVEEKKALLQEKEELLSYIQLIEQKKNELLKQAEKKKYTEIYAEIREKVPLEDEVIAQLNKYGITDEKIKELSPEVVLSEVKSWVRFLSNLLQFKWWQLLLMGLAALVLVFVLINPNGIIDSYLSYVRCLGFSFFAVAGPLFTKLYSTFKQFEDLYKPVKDYKNKFNKELEDVRQQYEKDMREVNEKLRHVANDLNAKNEQLNNLSEKITVIEYEVGNSITGKAFFDFIRNRSKDERYDKSLGIITIIRRDFETLSELFRDYNIPKGLSPKEQEEAEKKLKEIEGFKDLFTKPLDRIVLYVDDLDRCPEERVIEVLEAVNLLMAFPLFVVVVGVDPRWVKNALIKKYTLQFTGMLNNHKALKGHGVEPIHVTDYLEKIFQIPFYLRDADDNGIGALINDILGGQVRTEAVKPVNGLHDIEGQIDQLADSQMGTGLGTLQLRIGGTERKQEITEPAKQLVHFRPEDLKIAKEEVDDLKQLAWLIGSNPRSLKRYVNIYRIIRAHENLSYEQQEQRQNFLAIMFLLGLSLGEYKQQTKMFYETCFKQPDGNLKALVDVLDKQKQNDLATGLAKMQLPEGLLSITGKDFTEYIPFVKRFSFDNPFINI